MAAVITNHNLGNRDWHATADPRTPRRLTLVIASLGCGGAERVLTMMANYWTEHGWDITLVSFDSADVRPFYPLAERVTRVGVGLRGESRGFLAAMANNFARIRSVRRAIRASKPDAVISFMDCTNVVTVLATRGLNIPIVVAERTDPAMHSIGKAWDLIRTLTYPFADALVAQTSNALTSFSRRVQARGRVIPNPVLPQDKLVRQMPSEPPPQRTVIAVGRLEQVKGFDLLLKAFAKVAARHDDWQLLVIGEGSDRSDLVELRDSLRLEGRVHFPGTTERLGDDLARADLFVLSSRYEGFPNALCEAMASGLPVIATDCPSGPGDIIRHEVDGLLVPTEDVQALAAAMERLMSNEDERNQLAARAVQVTERFAVDNVLAMWEETVEMVSARRKGART